MWRIPSGGTQCIWLPSRSLVLQIRGEGNKCALEVTPGLMSPRVGNIQGRTPQVTDDHPGTHGTPCRESEVAKPSFMLDTPVEGIDALEKGCETHVEVSDGDTEVFNGDHLRNKRVKSNGLWWVGIPHNPRVYVPKVPTLKS